MSVSNSTWVHMPLLTGNTEQIMQLKNSDQQAIIEALIQPLTQLRDTMKNGVVRAILPTLPVIGNIGGVGGVGAGALGTITDLTHLGNVGGSLSIVSTLLQTISNLIGSLLNIGGGKAPPQGIRFKTNLVRCWRYCWWCDRRSDRRRD